MLTELPWQLQVVLFEPILCLFIATYYLNHRTHMFKRTRLVTFLWFVWDAVFFTLFVAAAHANVWALLVSVYFLWPIFKAPGRFIHPEVEAQPIITEVTLERIKARGDGSQEAVASSVASLRGGMTFAVTVYYVGIVLLIVLGAA